MRKITFLLLFFSGLGSVACGRAPLEEGIQGEWREVLAVKRRMMEAPPERQSEARQAYADALGGFVRAHPDHGRARAAYRELELEYARLLAQAGRYDDAVRHYRAVADADPENEIARAELEEAERKRFVTEEALSALRRGMSREEVAERLGRPLPGWSRKMDRGASTTESWFYRRRDGGVAGVYFRDGALFAAEFEGPVRLDS